MKLKLVQSKRELWTQSVLNLMGFAGVIVVFLCYSSTSWCPSIFWWVSVAIGVAGGTLATCVLDKLSYQQELSTSNKVLSVLLFPVFFIMTVGGIGRILEFVLEPFAEHNHEDTFFSIWVGFGIGYWLMYVGGTTVRGWALLHQKEYQDSKDPLK